MATVKIIITIKPTYILLTIFPKRYSITKINTPNKTRSPKLREKNAGTPNKGRTPNVHTTPHTHAPATAIHMTPYLAATVFLAFAVNVI